MLLKMLTFYLTMYFVVLNCFIKLMFYKTQLILGLKPTSHWLVVHALLIRLKQIPKVLSIFNV